MKTIQESELSNINGGDDFWADLAQFVGGSTKGLINGTFSVPGNPSSLISGALIAGVAAAMLN